MREALETKKFKIGELAQRLGLNVRTLRYYERIGLLPAPPRSEGGYRLYSKEDEQLLRFVLQAKSAGFSLDEIQRIVELGRNGSPCNYVCEALSRHIATLDVQIAKLQELRAGLVQAATRWEKPEVVTQGHICGLIERFSSLDLPNKEIVMEANKRKVEVFTAGCPVCEPVVELVRRLACESCEVTVYNLKDDPEAAARAKAAGVQRVPMVMVDGKPAECCSAGAVTEEGLRAAGIGAG